MNFARRQQYRRLSRAGRVGLTDIGAAALGFFAVRSCPARCSWPSRSCSVSALATGCPSPRSRVGARSEDEVRRALARLVEHGWRLRHGLRWQGAEDIDSVALAPNGAGFAIETKTRMYDVPLGDLEELAG